MLLRSIWMFTKFDTPWLMIQGGGAETYIRTLPVYTYMRTFAYYEAGLGSAMAVVMFLVLAAVTAIYFPHLAARGKPMSRAFSLMRRAASWCCSRRLVLLVFTAFPFAWMASTAFKPSREIFLTPPTLWPAHLSTLDNLRRLFDETRFLTYFRNSVTVSLSTVGLTLLCRRPPPTA